MVPLATELAQLAMEPPQHMALAQLCQAESATEQLTAAVSSQEESATEPPPHHMELEPLAMEPPLMEPESVTEEQSKPLLVPPLLPQLSTRRLSSRISPVFF